MELGFTEPATGTTFNMIAPDSICKESHEALPKVRKKLPAGGRVEATIPIEISCKILMWMLW